MDNSELLSDRLSANNVRRLAEVYLIRDAYLKSNNLQDKEVLSTPELNDLHEPLDQLHSPEMRRMGRSYGLTSLSPLDEGNRETLLAAFDLAPEYWERGWRPC